MCIVHSVPNFVTPDVPLMALHFPESVSLYVQSSKPYLPLNHNCILATMTPSPMPVREITIQDEMGLKFFFMN